MNDTVVEDKEQKTISFARIILEMYVYSKYVEPSGRKGFHFSINFEGLVFLNNGYAFTNTSISFERFIFLVMHLHLRISVIPSQLIYNVSHSLL